MRHPYIQQRFHPRLKIGYTAVVEQGKRKIPVHCRQGEIDGACGTYCSAIALTILGKISDPTVISERRNGVAARLWAAAQASYFDGIRSKALAKLLESLDAGLFIQECGKSHRSILAFTKTQLEAGAMVILSWQNRTQHHWVLAIGTEGKQVDEVFIPQAFLALDPAAPYPILCGYNGRVEFSDRISAQRPSYVHYFSTNDGNPILVTLTGAVSVGENDESKAALPLNKNRNKRVTVISAVSA